MFDSECTSHLSLIDQSLINTLPDIERGIEKEGLRVNSSNDIAQTGHPESLGSTLTHPSITTDYSEALLEFITPKQKKVEDSVSYLADLHQFTLNNMGEELVWPASMPCRLQGDASIPIALYGSSNVGTLKHVYRQGLGLRYGRVMQSIAGIHYNFSLPDTFWQAYQASVVKKTGEIKGELQEFKSAHYFSLIRNFRRYSWLLHYLFGASPVLDRSFLNGHPHQLEQLQENTFGLSYATSLRMSDLGYQNSAQEELHISYCSLDGYVTTLAEAMHQAYQPYQEIGVKQNGEYKQLNTNVLQIENEYYSDIRPKRVTHSGEKPIAALRERGVEYIEVRILDINPFLAEGLDAEQIRFMDAFLLYCLLSQCPETSTTCCPEIKSNQHSVIMQGRDPELKVCQDGKVVPFAKAANDLLDAIMETAKLLDTAHASHDYSMAINAQKAKIANPELTPSGRIMAMVNQGEEFLTIARKQADVHRQYFSQRMENIEFVKNMHRLSQQSLQQQSKLEAQDTLSFEEYLDNYNRS